MMQYIKCEKCGEYGIQLIGDKELPCEDCAYNEEDIDMVYDRIRDEQDEKNAEEIMLEEARERHYAKMQNDEETGE